MIKKMRLCSSKKIFLL